MIKTTDELRTLYETSRWRRAAHAFLRLHPLCASGCGRRSQVVDHITPRSSARTEAELHQLTWDRSNWQALSKPCHDAKTREEQRGKRLPPTVPQPSSIITRDYTRRVA
jgi:5-methylcytosine-specific restriction endonuclease McrA